MGAGTHEIELARTRALLRVASSFLKGARGPEQRKVALSRIDQLLDRYQELSQRAASVK